MDEFFCYRILINLRSIIFNILPMDSQLQILTQAVFKNTPPDLILPTIRPTKARIAHFGVGVFHRAHQSLYTLNAMEKTNDDTWGILGVGIMPFDKNMVSTLKKQDCLYTLTEKASDGKVSTRVMSTLFDYIFGPENLQEVSERLASEQIQVITMTITEGGYFIKKDTGEFDITNQIIKHEIENWSKEAPKTIYGYLARILDRRMKTHGKGVTILSCDNIQHNGDYLAKGFLSFLIKAHPELLTWTKQNCTFPNSMVDRITPQSAQKDLDYITDKFKICDQSPVVSEDFLQWIIEDKFVYNKPPWEVSGAKFVTDVTPYEKMKLRILNGSHQALCYVGALHGYKYVHQAAQDEIIKNFVNQYVKEEVLETLDEVPGINLPDYCCEVMQRFSNAAVLDTLSRICEFTSDRIPLFNVPPMLDMQKRKKQIPKSAMIVASWIVFVEEHLKNPSQLAYVDNRKQEVINAVEGIKNEGKVSQFLKLPGMFGSLSSNAQFCQMLERSYLQLKSGQYLECFNKML